MDEKVSVIIPVYKVEKYLDRCVESVVNQTYCNLEIILVDDGSPDNCPQMCDEWAAKDERIKVIHKENAGLGMARNSGLNIATGDYLMFVDSDDYLSANAVEVLYNRLAKDESDLAIGKHVDIYEDGRQDDAYCEFMEDRILTTDELLGLMGKRNVPVAAWGKLYKKEALSNDLYPALRCGEDMWAFAAVLEACNKVSLVNEKVYFYFQRDDSIVHNKTIEARLDEIKANLYLAQYLWQRRATQTAKKYFSRAVDFAFTLEEAQLKYARVILNEYFGREKYISMFKIQNTKVRVKWLLLYAKPMHKMAQRAINARR